MHIKFAAGLASLALLGQCMLLPYALARPLRGAGKLAACLLARDGNRDIRDWIEYHLWAGVDKVFLYDHNSTVPMLWEISDYVSDGKVLYTFMSAEIPDTMALINSSVPGGAFAHGLQGRVFKSCFARARGHQWLMFTDLDEYMIVTDPKYNNSIPAVLQEYQEAGAVMVHWTWFGSGGVQRREPGQSVLDTFTKCIQPANPHVKAIAQVGLATVGNNAHTFNYLGGRHGLRVGDKAVMTSHSLEPAVDSPLSVFHYIGAVEEYTERITKLSRGVSGMTTKKPEMYGILDGMATAERLEGRRAYGAMARRPRPNTQDSQAEAGTCRHCSLCVGTVCVGCSMA